MKENLSINLKNTSKFISSEEIIAHAQQSVRHLDTLNKGTGPGNDFLGWMTLPDDILPQLERIEKTAEHIRSVSDTTIVIGIGGSYLGARAVIEALSHSFSPFLKNKHHDVIFAGQNISEDYLAELIELLEGRNQEQQQNLLLHSEYLRITWKEKSENRLQLKELSLSQMQKKELSGRSRKPMVMKHLLSPIT